MGALSAATMVVIMIETAGADADNSLHNSHDVDGRRTMLIQNFKDHHPAFYQALGDLPASRPKYNRSRQYDRERRALAAQNQKRA
jgi:hypothetical protein